jgi:hypothetical protein
MSASILRVLYLKVEQQVHPKCWYASAAKLHGLTHQKIVTLKGDEISC